MYVYELARDLGAEPRELIEHAALAGLGHLVPNSSLSPEQATALRDAYIKAASPSRGSLFSGGAPVAAPPPTPPPTPPAAWDDPVPSTSTGGAFDGIDAPLSGAGLGEPLGFAPPGGAAPSSSPPPPPSAPPTPPPSTSPPAAPRWDDPQPWDPLPGGITLGGGPVGYDDPPPPRPTVDYSAPVPDREYQPHFPVDDRRPPSPGSSASRSVLIGVVGLAVVVLVSMFAARQMGIIGPGAERTCLLYTDPDPAGEGIIEELVCVDGYGKEVRREIRTPGAGVRGLEFGTTEAGDTARVVDLAGFCRGAGDFLDFRTGINEQISSASSVGVMGRWYEDNDGFGEGGVETMISSFGNAGPNQRVVGLRSYLGVVRDAGRSPDLAQAQMLLAAAEAEHGEAATSVRNFANNNC